MLDDAGWKLQNWEVRTIFWADVQMFTDNSTPDFTSYLSGWTSKRSASKTNGWSAPKYSRYQNPQFDVVTIPLVSRPPVSSGIGSSLKNVVPTGWDSEMYSVPTGAGRRPSALEGQARPNRLAVREVRG